MHNRCKKNLKLNEKQMDNTLCLMRLLAETHSHDSLKIFRVPSRIRAE